MATVASVVTMAVRSTDHRVTGVRVARRLILVSCSLIVMPGACRRAVGARIRAITGRRTVPDPVGFGPWSRTEGPVGGPVIPRIRPRSRAPTLLDRSTRTGKTHRPRDPQVTRDPSDQLPETCRPRWHAD